MSKLTGTLREAVINSGLKDGMSISFHHHLRNGDYVLNMVMDLLSDMGFKNLIVCASSIHDVHEPLIKHIQSGVVGEIRTSYISAKVGRCISEGGLEKPVTFFSHGTRAARVISGEDRIDVAFIAAPAADEMGNASGKYGKSACGSIGYAVADAEHAAKVIVITDELMPYPLTDRAISETDVDYVVKVPAIGDPSGIISGTTRMPKDPIALRIADLTAAAIDASGMLTDGFSFQTGAGGASLATAVCLKEYMKKRDVCGSFALGGITGYIVDMKREGYFRCIQDVQCFDLKAVESIRTDPDHLEISAAEYSSPKSKSTAASKLSAVVLGATEIDTDFNVNVHIDSNGYIIGGSGGHTDVAEGSKLTIIAAPLSRARQSTIVDRVGCISTPGDTVDILVTQAGIAVNPDRRYLRDSLEEAGLEIYEIQDLKEMADRINGKARRNEFSGRVVADVLGRYGETLDHIRQVK